jgi:hypothetical protein
VVTVYEIKLRGCDGSTRFVMDLSAKEAALLQVVAERSEKTSVFSCQPTLILTTPPPPADEEDEL